jgi:hypothetical protein
MQEITRRREGFISDDEPEKVATPEEEAPPPLPDEWPLVVKLRRPIENDKREMIG